jgi:hypothetical protein
MAKKGKGGREKVSRRGLIRAEARVERGIAGIEPSVFSVSTKSLQALSPHLRRIREAIPDIDVETVRKDLEARIPPQKDLDRAVQAGMTAYEAERKRWRKPKPSRQQEEEMRERLAVSLRHDLTSLWIDEELVRYNVERSHLTVSILENKAFLVTPTGQVAMEVRDLRDPRSLDIQTLMQIVDMLIEIGGLISALFGLRVDPNSRTVQRVVESRVTKDQRFRLALIEMLSRFGMHTTNSIEIGKAIAMFMWKVYEECAGFWNDFARGLFEGVPWYQLAWYIAKFVGGIASLFMTAAATIYYKLAIIAWRIAKLIEKYLKLKPTLAGAFGPLFGKVRAAEIAAQRYA